ncbi:MAG TPA: ATP-binding protein [Ignavibacteria bacterium]|nr:ATP-binding protein [Ignavibacteria bacterium]
MKYLRTIEKYIIPQIDSNKAILILGARRVGKTFLLNQISNSIDKDFIRLIGEEFTVMDLFRIENIQSIRNLIGEKKLLIIDEAQKINNIGNIIKLLLDTNDKLTVILTGSSSFDLSNKFGEPLTGRKYSLILYPFSQKEINEKQSILETQAQLEERLIFGSYPEILNINEIDNIKKYLNELINDYLLKDILNYENIRNSQKIFNILKFISYQVGSNVSLEEISKKVQISRNTVEKYIDILCKVFILYKLSGFSRNLRSEISKTSKYYFIDNGIRNAIISNFNFTENRDDIGKLWENYIISERLKYLNNNNIFSNNYYWKNYDKQEIDWIEERDGKLFAYEIKWKDNYYKFPKSFTENYPESETKLINNSNYLEFIT